MRNYEDTYAEREAARILQKDKENKIITQRIMFGAMCFISSLIFFAVLFGSWYTIDEGERGVKLRNGQVIGSSDPGLHFKVPFIDDVVKLSVQNHIVQYVDMPAYSRDQQLATMRVTVNYRLSAPDITTVYSDYGSESALVERIINPRVAAEAKNVFGQFNAVTAIQDRARLNVEVLNNLQSAIVGPVTIEDVNIEDINFSDAYDQSIEARMSAEVEVQRIKQNLEREKVEAEIATTRAKAAADSAVLTATAEADAIRLKGNAEAEAIKARGDALRENPDLVELVQAEKWNGQLPQTMLPNGTMPILNVGGE